MNSYAFLPFAAKRVSIDGTQKIKTKKSKKMTTKRMKEKARYRSVWIHRASQTKIKMMGNNSEMMNFKII